MKNLDDEFLRFINELDSLWTILSTKPKKTDRFGMDRELVKKLRPFFDFLYNDYWRIKVAGIKKIKPHGAGLIVANHSGVLPYDGAMLKLSLLNHHPAKRDLRFLVGKFAVLRSHGPLNKFR